jgi:hypothetical protein
MEGVVAVHTCPPLSIVNFAKDELQKLPSETAWVKGCESYLFEYFAV